MSSARDLDVQLLSSAISAPRSALEPSVSSSLSFCTSVGGSEPSPCSSSARRCASSSVPHPCRRPPPRRRRRAARRP
eukprot:scaffold12503_cov48-Phaeocystis_antarctica.AAC.1